MAHQLDLKVVAEGVETSEQLEFLRQHGCDYIQGYYYFRPLPESEFVEMLEESGIPSGKETDIPVTDRLNSGKYR